MLPKKRRISRPQFDDVFARGHFVNNQVFSLKVAQLAQSGQPTKIACVVSKKVAKRAVDRNRLRRRVYGVLQELLPHIRPGFGIIVLTKTTLVDLPTIDLVAAMINILKLSQVYND